MEQNTEFIRSILIQSRMANTLPFKQEQVGPGLTDILVEIWYF